jgi:hypothetical protein
MKRLLALLAIVVVAAAASAQTVEKATERFALAYFPYLPSSTVELSGLQRLTTPAGGYIAVNLLRSSPLEKEKDQIGALIDPTARTITVGLLYPTPAGTPFQSADTLQQFVEVVLPEILRDMGRVSVRLPSSPNKPNAVVSLTASLRTGYGPVKLPLAVSADARFLLLGTTWPLDRDPRATRREILAKAPIQWDPGHESAPLTLVEFSDFQCPACKRGWTIAKEILGKLGDKVHHGMVNFPLTNSHPWAFRAAVAGHCVGAGWPDRFLLLKEEFYLQQESLTVETVDQAAFLFISGNKLDEPKFRSCYMKDPAVDAVLKQMELGQRLNVLSTPTYFANGEILPFGNKEIWEKRLQAILAAGGLPENAAEIRVEPTPVPTKAPVINAAPTKAPATK